MIKYSFLYVNVTTMERIDTRKAFVRFLTYVFAVAALAGTPAAFAQLGESIEGTIMCRTTIQWETNRQLFIPRKFPIEVVIANTSDTAIALYPGAEIILPAGIVLAPSVQPVHQFQNPPLEPQQSVTFTWWVYVDSTYFLGAPKNIRAIIDFKDPDLPPSTHHIKENIEHPGITKNVVTIPFLDVGCSISCLDSVRTLNDTALVPEVVRATCMLFNTGDTPVHIGRASIFITELATGAMVFPFDRHRYIASALQPGDSVQLAWNIDALKLMYDRTADFKVVVYDTIGYPQSECYEWFYIPEILGLTCRIEGQDRMRMNHATGQYEPDSVVLKMKMKNHFDSLQFIPEATIDLTNAPHFRLSRFSQATNKRTRIEADSEIEFEWTLFVDSPPTKRIIERIDFSTTFFKYPGREYCSHEVVFEDPAPLPDCYIDLPDTITLCGKDYCPSVFTLNYRIANPKDSTFPVERIVLDLGDGLDTQQSMEVTTGTLPAHDSRHYSWTVSTRRSKYARQTHCYVAALDSNGQELLRCGRTYVLPAMPADILCSISTAVDTIHYLPSELRYDPEEFHFVASLNNITDTVLANVEATFNTGKSTFFTVALGQTRTQTAQSIDPGGEFAFGWTALINSVTDEYYTDTLHVEVEVNNDGILRECLFPVVVSPRKTVSVGDISSAHGIALHANYPNPFTSSTVLSYYIPAAMPVHLAVYNTLGTLRKTVVNGLMPPGAHTAKISGLAPGAYIAVMRTGEGTLTKRILAK